MKIDSHVHISIFENNAINLKAAFSALLKDMEANQVDFAIIIPDNIENSSNIADLEKARELIKNSNKFFLLASPLIIERGSSEIEKYKKLIQDGVVKGIKLFPGHDPYYPTDKRCLPYYKLCQSLDCPVLFHTGANSDDINCLKWNDPKYIVEIAKKYPRLKIGIAHYFWPKLEYCYEITKNIPNIYFDISAMADDEVIEKSGGIKKMKNVLKKTINNRSDNVILGSDWPMCKIKDHIDIVNSLNLESDVKNKIFYKNSINLYKLAIKL